MKKLSNKCFLYLAICLGFVYVFVDESSQMTLPESWSHHLRRQLDLSPSWPSPPRLLKQFDNKKHGKRLVVAGVTCGYLEFADNFVQSLERNGVDNYLLVPLDQRSFDVLRVAYPDHTLHRMPGMAEAPAEATFWALKDFKTLTSSRPEFMLSFLNKGYTIMYNDIDRVWLQNVFLEFDRIQEKRNNVTLIVVDDTPLRFNNKTESPNYSTSLLYMEPTETNKALLREWRDAILADDKDRIAGDQGYFNEVFMQFKQSNRIKPDQWHRTDTCDFPTGNDYFFHFKNFSALCQHQNIQVVHANYMVGKKNKRKRLLEMGHWNLSGKISPLLKCG